MKLCCLSWRITLKQKCLSGSPFLNELLMSSPFNLSEVAVLWHLTEQNNNGRNIAVSYWPGSNLLGSAWFDMAFRGTSEYTFLEEEGEAEQIVIHWKLSFLCWKLLLPSNQILWERWGFRPFGKQLGLGDFLQASSVLLNDNLLCLKWSLLSVSVVFCSWKNKLIISVCPAEHVFLSLKLKTLKLVSWEQMNQIYMIWSSLIYTQRKMLFIHSEHASSLLSIIFATHLFLLVSKIQNQKTSEMFLLYMHTNFLKINFLYQKFLYKNYLFGFSEATTIYSS